MDIKSRLNALEVKQGASGGPIIVCFDGKTPAQAKAAYEARNGTIVGSDAIYVQFVSPSP